MVSGRIVASLADQLFLAHRRASVLAVSVLVGRHERKGDAGIEAAERLIRLLAQHLGIHPRYVWTGYEDVFYYLWEEGKLPVNMDPLETDLKDPLERQRLARLLDRDLGQPKGYALPLRPDPSGKGWQSSLWEFRREQMFLLPGDSPMGLRLPLDSLPWVAPEEREIEEESSPMASRPPLGNFHARFESGPEPIREQQRPAAPSESDP